MGPAGQASPKATPKAEPKASPKASPKAEAKAKAKAKAMMDDDDDDMEDEEGEEEEPPAKDEAPGKELWRSAWQVVKPKASPKAEPKKASPKASPKAREVRRSWSVARPRRRLRRMMMMRRRKRKKRKKRRAREASSRCWDLTGAASGVFERRPCPSEAQLSGKTVYRHITYPPEICTSKVVMACNGQQFVCSLHLSFEENTGHTVTVDRTAWWTPCRRVGSPNLGERGGSLRQGRCQGQGQGQGGC